MEQNNFKNNQNCQNNFNAFENTVDFRAENKSECKAVVPLDFESEKKNESSKTNFRESIKNAFEAVNDEKKIRYRKKSASHILFVKAYLLFFFLGACFYASGKLGMRELSEKVFGELSVKTDGFSDFCVRFSPLLFGSFFVYSSGFTIYASLLSALYSVSSFFLCGAVACEVVFQMGVSLESLGCLLLIGLFCGECILLCSVTRGISEIASEGISKLSIQDGVLYSVLYMFTVALNYYLIMLICFLIKA